MYTLQIKCSPTVYTQVISQPHLLLSEVLNPTEQSQTRSEVTFIPPIILETGLIYPSADIVTVK